MVFNATFNNSLVIYWKLQSKTDKKPFKSFHYERTCILLCFVFRRRVCPMLPVSLDCSFLLVEETGVPGEIHRPVANH
jgi:hypothetical protein